MISLLYASARPNKIIDVLSNWLIKASWQISIEAIVVTDTQFNTKNTFDTIKFITNHSKHDCVTAYNLAAANANGDIFIQIADDLFPEIPEHNWDKVVWSLLDIKKPQILAVSDNINSNYQTQRHAIVTREYYKKIGYLLFPAYESMYSDDDFSEMMHRHGEVIDGTQQIKLRHEHVGPHLDAVSAVHEGTDRYIRGAALFNKRRLERFPI